MKKIYTAFLFGFLSVSLLAQKNPRKPTLGFGVQVVQPLGQYGDTYDGYPAGFSGTFTGPIGRSPIEVGMGVAWNSMGSQNEEVMVSTGVFDSEGDEIVKAGKMKIGINNYRYTAIGRFKPFAGMIQPYGEVLAGFENYSTRTVITMDDNPSSDARDRNVYQRDFGFVAGWAAGLRIEMIEGVMVEGRFENLRGSEASYVDQESITIDDGHSISFDTKTSVTDKYAYTLGIAFRF
ncbi:MAG: hypothetical protein SH856_05030 [Flavobacteriales bacterium]|nr:hypothetical protein [Flavobacteriales bacterium]